MSNKWVEFVRKWSKKHNQSYMCAATKEKCRAAYHKAYPKQSTKKMSPSSSKKYKAMTRKVKMLKNKTQKELLDKYVAYAEHKRKKAAEMK